MATKFVQASSKKLQLKTAMHDTDSPLPVFLEVAALNTKHGLTMKDWNFTLHDYKGEKIGKYNWQNQFVTVRLGDLFS